MSTKRSWLHNHYFDTQRCNLHPQIHLQDVEYVDINTFNSLAASNDLILSAECWSGVHPLLVTLPVEWNYRLPYGLIYTKNPSKEVRQFIMAIGQVSVD